MIAAFVSFLPPFGTPAGEIARATLVAATFAFIFVTAEAWRRRFHPPAEWTRKYVHFAGGVVTAFFPWLFRHHWTILALAALSAGTLGIARLTGLLGSVHAVERESKGELYFPVGVYLLFVLARGRPVFYLIALFTLIVADALAAVLGKAYGKHRYLVTSDRRSFEGAAVFLFVAFLCVHLPLLLMTDIDRGASVLIGVQLALLVACFEAISTGGNDNLILPLATYYLLLKMTPRPAAAIGLQLVVQLAILGVVLLLAWRTRFLSFSGALAAHLVLYAAFSLGGPQWVIAPALTLAALLIVDATVSRTVGVPRGGYHVMAIFYVSLVAVLLIFADNTFATLARDPGGLGAGHPFYVLFVGSLAAPLAVLAFQVTGATPRVRRQSTFRRALGSAALGLGAVAPVGLWQYRSGAFAEGLAVAGAMSGGAIALYLAGRRLLPAPPWSAWDFRLLTMSVLLATLLATPFHLRWLGVVGWRLE